MRIPPINRSIILLSTCFALTLTACGESESTSECDAATCTQPPSASCDGNTLITYAQAGTCDTSGDCSYGSTETDCTEAGLVCLNATCTEDTTTDTGTDTGSDPCDGVTCEEPPANTCNGNTAVTYGESGTCTDGTCEYTATETDCGDNATCTDGVCVDNPVDPCDGVTCNAPPAITCDGNTLVTYEDGVCDETGGCLYEEVRTDCGDTATCTEGVCVEDPVDPCEGVVCEAPPAPACVGNSIVDSALPGTCVEGVCGYVETSTDCSSGEWCYAASCSTLDIMITEIHYNPSTAQGEDTDFEFLELYNAGDTVDLEGFTFEAGITHTFTSQVFPSDSFLVLTVNADNYAGVTAPVIQWESGGLTNSGELITLLDPAGNTVDSLTFDDGSGWPTAADGAGRSLELIDTTSDNSLAESWQASWVENGTPGEASSTAPATVAYTITTLKTEDHTGEGVSTGGIVTATYSDRYAIQDGSGSYSGIWVIGTGVTVGDDVTVEGVMGNLSDLLAITQSAVTVNSSGNTLPEAEVLTTLAIQDDSWEGVLATTTGTCTATANNYNEWSIDDSSGALLVDDLGYEFAQEVVDGIYTVTSPVYYSFGAFKLVPMSSDYVGLADACSVVTCDAPPAAACIGNELLTYPAEGSCSDGACTYAVTNTDCGDSATCTDGANGSLCVDNSVDLCADVVCEAPPADTCDGNASITYPAVGSCDATGACTYEAASTDCGDATCVDGVCSSVSIVISEIHYNPGSDQGSDNDYEFIELYNAGDTVDLAGFQVTTALNHTFTSYTFQSGSYLVLAKNAASFADLGDSVIQWDSGSINNTGETIVVQDASGVTLDTVSYEDGSPWPSAPDGSGPSLSLIDLTSDNSLPESWAESSVTGGTPGYAN